MTFTKVQTGPHKPHIVFHLTDDHGYYHFGFNSERSEMPSEDVLGVTPHTTELALKEGIVLSRHYVHWHCSPSRRAFLTGRLPLHMGEALSPEDADDMDLRWQTIGQKLESAGYASYMFGKGHTGYRSVNHLPHRRGFSGGFVGFLSAGMYHNNIESRWRNDSWLISRDPSPTGVNLAKLSTSKLEEDEKVFSTRHWSLEALQVLKEHDVSRPIFMYLAWQEPHRPYEAPPGWSRSKQSCDGFPLDESSVQAAKRTDACAMYGMIGFMDDQMRQMTELLKKKSMWANTLMVIASDNGGVDAGVNYPLRGEKHTSFEGGIRGATAVTGGIIPAELRGTINRKVFSITDWYPTFCVMAGVSPTDDPPEPPAAAPTGKHADLYGDRSFPGVDGVNIWPFLSQPDYANSTDAKDLPHEFLAVTSEVMVSGRYKLIVAQPNPDIMKEKHVNIGWRLPNGKWNEADDAEWPCSTYWDRENLKPCLFDVHFDYAETHDIAPKYPALTAKLWKKLNESLLTRYTVRSPDDMMGPCEERCASRYYVSTPTKKHYRHPVCGVPGCS